MFSVFEVYCQDLLFSVLSSLIYQSTPWAFKKHEICTRLPKTHFAPDFDFATLMAYLVSGCFDFVTHHFQTDSEALSRGLDNSISSQQRNLYILNIKSYQIFRDLGDGTYKQVSLEEYIDIWLCYYPYRYQRFMGYFSQNFQPIISEHHVLPGYLVYPVPVIVNNANLDLSRGKLEEPTSYVLIVLDNQYPPQLKSVRPISISDVERYRKRC